MPVPHHVEADFREIFLHEVEARESGVEFLALIVSKAGPVARDEAVFASSPFAKNVDGIVELSSTNFRQKTRFQDLGNEACAPGCDGGLFLFGRGSNPHPSLFL